MFRALELIFCAQTLSKLLNEYCCSGWGTKEEMSMDLEKILRSILKIKVCFRLLIFHMDVFFTTNMQVPQKRLLHAL